MNVITVNGAVARRVGDWLVVGAQTQQEAILAVNGVREREKTDTQRLVEKHLAGQKWANEIKLVADYPDRAEFFKEVFSNAD